MKRKLNLSRETVRMISNHQIRVAGAADYQGASGTNTAGTDQGCACLTDGCSVAYCLTTGPAC